MKVSMSSATVVYPDVKWKRKTTTTTMMMIAALIESSTRSVATSPGKSWRNEAMKKMKVMMIMMMSIYYHELHSQLVLLTSSEGDSSLPKKSTKPTVFPQKMMSA